MPKMFGDVPGNDRIISEENASCQNWNDATGSRSDETDEMGSQIMAISNTLW